MPSWQCPPFLVFNSTNSVLLPFFAQRRSSIFYWTKKKIYIFLLNKEYLHFVIEKKDIHFLLKKEDQIFSLKKRRSTIFYWKKKIYIFYWKKNIYIFYLEKERFFYWKIKDLEIPELSQQAPTHWMLASWNKLPRLLWQRKNKKTNLINHGQKITKLDNFLSNI